MALTQIITSILAITSTVLLGNCLPKNDSIERRIKVAILDTGIDKNSDLQKYLCKYGHKDFTNSTINDTHGHGTNIAGIIAKEIDPKYFCVIVVKFTGGSGSYKPNGLSYIAALRYAVEEAGAQYINISAGGDGYITEERSLLSNAITSGKFVIVAAGNKNIDLVRGCGYYPACYFFMSKFFRVVGNGYGPNKKSLDSNYGMGVTDWENGQDVCAQKYCFSGTSQSTAKFTAKLIKQHLTEVLKRK